MARRHAGHRHPQPGQGHRRRPGRRATCAVNRIWDWALNRGDIVNNLATVPTDVTLPYVEDFTKNGMNLKTVIRDIFTSDDFVHF